MRLSGRYSDILLQKTKSRLLTAFWVDLKIKRFFYMDRAFTKIIVKNVAFQATSKDIRQLFSPFGTLKSVRLPKKFDGTPRGFAFVEFVMAPDAKTAHQALKRTHLYGRHLVLEASREVKI